MRFPSNAVVTACEGRQSREGLLRWPLTDPMKGLFLCLFSAVVADL